MSCPVVGFYLAQGLRMHAAECDGLSGEEAERWVVGYMSGLLAQMCSPSEYERGLAREAVRRFEAIGREAAR